MTIATAVTDMSRAEEVTDHPKNGGRFVHGLYIEGAAWMHDEEECEDYDVNGVPCRYVGLLLWQQLWWQQLLWQQLLWQQLLWQQLLWQQLLFVFGVVAREF